MKLITNHFELAMARLAEEFRGIPEIAVLIKANCRQVQDLENAIFGLFSALGVTNANSYLLGIYGKVVGLTPYARTLESQRNFVKAHIALNRSSGTIPELIAIVQIVAPDGAVVVVTTSKAAVAVRIKGVAMVDTDAFDTARLLGRARLGGVRGVLEWSTTDPGDTFVLDDATGALTVHGQGLGDAGDGTVGGELSGAAEAIR